MEDAAEGSLHRCGGRASSSYRDESSGGGTLHKRPSWHRVPGQGGMHQLRSHPGRIRCFSTHDRHSCCCLEAEKVTSLAVFQSLHDLHNTDTCPGAPQSPQSAGQQLQRPAHGEPPARTPQPPKCSSRHIQRGSGEHCFAQQKHSQCMVLMGPLVFLEPCLFLRLLMGLF